MTMTRRRSSGIRGSRRPCSRWRKARPAPPTLACFACARRCATARNGNGARDVCAQLNAGTATARWSVARERDADGSYYDEVQVSCAFVVGPHNADTLESFALWCVREQIAVATEHIHSGDVGRGCLRRVQPVHRIPWW